MSLDPRLIKGIGTSATWTKVRPPQRYQPFLANQAPNARPSRFRSVLASIALAKRHAQPDAD